MPFQNFLREQITGSLKYNPQSVNMVTKLSDFLVRLIEYDTRNPNIIKTEVAELVKTSLNVLSEFVIGPCIENQKILIENKKIIDVINRVLKESLNFHTYDSRPEQQIIMIETLSETTIFLESLVVGNNDSQLLGTLLRNLQAENFTEMLIVIYNYKLNNKMRDNFFLGNY